jgi:hypothetical protein
MRTNTTWQEENRIIKIVIPALDKGGWGMGETTAVPIKNDAMVRKSANSAAVAPPGLQQQTTQVTVEMTTAVGIPAAVI